MEFEIRNDLYPREKYLEKIRGFYHECEIIKVLTGVRRCGKSSIMNLVIQELLDQGVSKENIIYFNLDRKPFDKIETAEQLDEIIEKNKAANGKNYLFIDEIQNVEGFEKVINAWREEGNFSIFITGSNSYLLSGELVTKLTGRYIEFNILPLSFDEYLNIKKFFGKQVSTDNSAEIRNYIYEGGFPYVLKLNSMNDKRRYVQNLINEIYEKDIKRRVKIKNRSVFETIMKYVINNFGATTSIKNIVEDMVKNGVNIKRETVNRYIEALESAKIIMPCARFDIKSRKSLAGEKKYYLSDLSFYYALNTDNRINYGPALENIVYTYACSKDYSVSVGKIGKFECDFILRDNEMNYSYVQVAYTILESRETEDREYRSLESIKGDAYPRYLLTMDTLLQKRNGIIHDNLADFIKENKNF
ncbi:ATP-binding protein [bacterium]|nr:ATP-binding protein [bacterium]MBP5591696.1 ATP-binding protein [bacterium]